ncbi:unnamed protein product [Linum trigynum]|uniref:Uncharacterized protein n=1 Tax=Linum trigynum TaxID=586398 RepID=A0AAV2FSK1_9ROSI
MLNLPRIILLRTCCWKALLLDIKEANSSSEDSSNGDGSRRANEGREKQLSPTQLQSSKVHPKCKPKIP